MRCVNDGVRQDALIPAHLLAGLVLLFAVMCAFAALTTKPITLAVSPRVSFAPTTLYLRIFVPRDPANRAVRVDANGPDYARSSPWEGEGERATQTLFQVTWHLVPAGEYEVIASVVGVDRILGTDRIA